MNSSPLVSVIVITYNSSEFIVETLESAISQVYPNIEIVISDDCSRDNTVEICRQWISQHQNLGIRIILVENRRNTGVAGNCNRGLREARGEWVKVIAGDDILAETAILDYVDYVKKHPTVRHLIADSVWFMNGIQTSKPRSKYLYRDEVSAKWQYSIISKMFFGSGPTYFIHADTLKNIGGYDERFPMQEDYPLFIKMIRDGNKMEYMDKVTVYYRVSDCSVSHEKNPSAIFTNNQKRIVQDYKFLYRLEALDSCWKLCHFYSMWLQNMIMKLGNSYKRPLCVMFKLLYSVTDPFVLYARYINWCEQRFEKRLLRNNTHLK